jgi:HD-GYP domain-containing protein (c-di-GMP phosphodiesterase class II)
MAICDIYQALTEERPYRENLSSEKIWNIFNDMVNRKELDGILVNKIKAILP